MANWMNQLAENHAARTTRACCPTDAHVRRMNGRGRPFNDLVAALLT